ncbi:hypothetical protein I4U23_005000 [Adineta vaga]|nr:hypothetical protein I4U23_005000 [Adineta vaga]
MRAVQAIIEITGTVFVLGILIFSFVYFTKNRKQQTLSIGTSNSTTMIFAGITNSITINTTTIGLTSTVTSLAVQSNYSSTLTRSSSVYIRPKSYWSTSGFFYEAIEINVATTGMYTISSDSTMDTQGFIYNNSFNPSLPDQNLMSFDDDAGVNKQFILTVVLQATTKYILFVTSYAGNTLGEFSIIGLGPATINFSAINSSKIEFKSNYSSALTVDSPFYVRSYGSTIRFCYQAIEISVSTTGIYTISSNSTIDTYGVLYNNTFNPADPDRNQLSSDDQTGGNDQFLLANILQAMTTYILVVTTYYDGVTGDFSLVGEGPDSISFSPINSSRTQSRYSSALTVDSAFYIGSYGSKLIVYYEALEISVSTTGIYALFTNSTIDTYGAIYNNTFNPADPDQNQLSSDNQAGGNNQFLLTNILQAMTTYIMVVTTYYNGVTGKFSLIGQGPDSISFSPSKEYIK